MAGVRGGRREGGCRQMAGGEDVKCLLLSLSRCHIFEFFISSFFFLQVHREVVIVTTLYYTC